MINVIDTELSILRTAVEKLEKIKGKIKMDSKIISNILKIIEEFIIDNKLICYGGTAINNILPKEDQFYQKDIELPDYDVFSPNALEDVIKIADIYKSKGYADIEAKAGVHYGTYKLYINFIPVLDVTQLNNILFNSIKKDAILKNNILYAPPHFLKMSMYLELSRPFGDTSRWEKVFKRLSLLNKHYPFITKNKCNNINSFKRNKNINNKYIFNIIKNIIIKEQLIIFGSYALSLYSKNSKSNLINDKNNFYPDFDLLSNTPKTTAFNIIKALNNINITNIKLVIHSEIEEFISKHYEIQIDNQPIIFIYEPIACHSYNIIKINKKNIRVASIDTMLNFYLTFIYLNRPYYNVDRILCIIQYLFNLQNNNRLKQKGLFKRFTLTCYGKQPSMEDIKSLKANKFKELKHKKNSLEYKKWFLRYIPKNKTKKSTNKTKKSIKKSTKKSTKNSTKKSTKKSTNKTKKSINKTKKSTKK